MVNIDRVKVLVNIYNTKYEEMTSGANDPRNKWAAISSCVKKWDLDAADFAKMFAASMDKASDYIDEENLQPIKGILFLCKKKRTEEVRKAFTDLLARDGGDIAKRMDRVSAFVKTINGMLNEIAPDDWQYRQKIRTAIRYLAVIRPADNYLFKASECAEFAGYIEEDNEIGFDRFLKLPNYYRMCDDVADYIRNNRDDMVQLVRRGLMIKAKECADPDLVDIDSNLHILVYDLIDSAFRFDFYAEKAANRKSKISAVSKRKIDRTRKSAELLDEREACVDQLDHILAEESKTAIPALKGRKVDHKAFGEGKIKEQDGKYLIVQFKEITKKFALPGAIVNGFLHFDDTRYSETFREMEDMQIRRRQLEDQLTSIDVQLRMLE